MRKIAKLLFCCSFMACQSNEPSPPNGPQQPENPQNPNVPSGKTLLEKASVKDPVQRQMLKDKYAETPLHESFFSLFGDVPKSNYGPVYLAIPYIGNYGANPHDIVFAAYLPEVYWSAIPTAIQNILVTLDISELKLFWLVQSQTNLNPPGINFITHHWAALLPKTDWRKAGTVFKQNIDIAVFGPSNVKQDLNEKLQPFDVHIHDDAFSPNNAHLKLPIVWNKEVFWSLTYDPKTKRSAVVIHFLLPDFPADGSYWIHRLALDSSLGLVNIQTLIQKMRVDDEFKNTTALAEIEKVLEIP